MDPLTALMIGSAVGLGKSYLIDQPKEKRQRELAAKTQELSPWTGLKASGIEEADPFGSALQFGTTGAMMSAANKKDIAESARQTTMDNAYLDLVKAKTAQMGVPQAGAAQAVAPHYSEDIVPYGYGKQQPAYYSPWAGV